MSLDRLLPVEPLAAPRDIGMPFHGLVQGGTLTLPSGATMPYPQPATGDVFIVRRPGWTAPTRSPDQLAADAAADHEWRDYAIISGRMRSAFGTTSMHIGGKSVNGWIWFDPTGQAWRVHLANWGSYADNTARVMQLNFGRFGVFGGSLDEVSRSTPPFSILQAGAPEIQFRSTPSPAAYRVLEDNDPEIFHKLLDVSADGSRALFAAVVNHYDPAIIATTVPSIYVERVVAIYEVVIAANGEISGSCLKSRADCVGVVTWDDLGLYPYEVKTVSLTSYPPPACSVGTSWEQTIAEYSISTVSASFPLSSMVQPVRVGAAGDTGFGVMLPFENNRRVFGIALGAHYNAGGTVSFVTADIAWSEVGDGACNFSLTSFVQVGRCDDGVRNDDPTPTAFGDNWSTLVTRAELAIAVDGVEVVSEVFESTVSNTTLVSGSLMSGTTAWSVTHNGAVISSGGTTFPDESFFGAPSGSGKHIFGWLALEPPANLSGITNVTPPRQLDWLGAAFAGSGVSFRIAPARWNETTFGVVVQRLAGGGGAQHSFSDAVARGVVVPSAQTYSPASGSDLLVYPTGSYQPVTGQWAGGVSETPGASRCWV